PPIWIVVNLANQLRRVRRPLMLAHDAAVLIAAYIVFAALRYGEGVSSIVWKDVLVVAAIAVAFQGVIGIATHVYRHRHLVASLEEIVDLALTTALAGLATGLLNAFVLPDMIARAVPVAATPAALLVMVGTRVLWRHYWDRAELQVRNPAARR